MKIDWLATIGIIGTIATLIGLLYAWIVARRSERKKILTYDINSPFQLASVLPDRIEHRLSIIYERAGEAPVNIKGAYLRTVLIGNLGREPIRREDIAPSDPLRIEVQDSKVLDIADAGVSRDVINFKLTPFEESSEGVTTSKLSFDFLDYKDVVAIRILTEHDSAHVQVSGTIIGMPTGIKTQDELSRLYKFPRLRISIAAIVCLLSLGFTLRGIILIVDEISPMLPHGSEFWRVILMLLTSIFWAGCVIGMFLLFMKILESPKKQLTEDLIKIKRDVAR